MRRSPVVLITFGLLVVGLVTIVAAWQVSRLWQLPEIHSADREGLVRWLVLRDLREETAEVHRQLLSRIEVVFDDDIDLSEAARLDAQTRLRLTENISLLKEVWFHDKIDEFYQCAKKSRAEYLDRQIATLLRWAAIDAAVSKDDVPKDGVSRAPETIESSEPLGRYLTTFLDTIDLWITQIEPSGRQRARDVVKSGLTRWLATQDLDQESNDVKQQIVVGLEQHLGGQIFIGDSTDGFSKSEEERFWRNVSLLAEIWFGDKATKLATLQDHQRADFIIRQVDFVEDVFIGGNRTGPSVAATLTTDIDSWIKKATDKSTPTKAQLQQFAQQLRNGLAMRQIKDLMMNQVKQLISDE